MSRIIKFAKAGGPEVLEYIETDVAQPGPNEIRITVKAIGINRAESMWRNDDYIESVSFPARVGYEAAGIVDAIGSAVRGVQVGDAVNVIPSFSFNHYGTYGEALPRTADKKQQLLDAGAAHVVVTGEVDITEELARLTDGKGVRVAFDPVGGPTFSQLVSSLSFGGIAYIYGLLSTCPTELPVLDMIAKMVTVKPHNIRLASGDEARRKAAVDYVLRGFEAGALKPVIDRAFPFDQIREAHRYLEQNGQFGKIVATL